MNPPSAVSPSSFLSPDGTSPAGLASTRFKSYRKSDEGSFRSAGPNVPPEEALLPQNMVLTIVGAKNVVAADDNGKSDPYVRVELVDSRDGASVIKEVKEGAARARKDWRGPAKGANHWETEVIPNTLNPVWNQQYEIPLKYRRAPFRPFKMRFTMFDKDMIGKDDFLGYAEHEIKSLDDCVDYVLAQKTLKIPFGPRPGREEDLVVYYGKNRDIGTLHLTLRMDGGADFLATQKVQGATYVVNKLEINLVAARGLKNTETRSRPVVEYIASGDVDTKRGQPTKTSSQALRSANAKDPQWKANEVWGLMLTKDKAGETQVSMTVKSGPGGKFLGHAQYTIQSERQLQRLIVEPTYSKFTLNARPEDHPEHNSDMVFFLKNKKILGTLYIGVRASAVLAPETKGPVRPQSIPAIELGGEGEAQSILSPSNAESPYSAGESPRGKFPHDSSPAASDPPPSNPVPPSDPVAAAAPPAERRATKDAETLYKAMKGFGTDEDAIYTTLDAIESPEEWEAVRDRFRVRYASFHRGDLVAALRDELSSGEMDRAEGILSRNGVDLTGRYTVGQPQEPPDAPPAPEPPAPASVPEPEPAPPPSQPGPASPVLANYVAFGEELDITGVSRADSVESQQRPAHPEASVEPPKSRKSRAPLPPEVEHDINIAAGSNAPHNNVRIEDQTTPQLPSSTTPGVSVNPEDFAALVKNVEMLVTTLQEQQQQQQQQQRRDEDRGHGGGGDGRGAAHQEPVPPEPVAVAAVATPSAPPSSDGRGSVANQSSSRGVRPAARRMVRPRSKADSMVSSKGPSAASAQGGVRNLASASVQTSLVMTAPRMQDPDHDRVGGGYAPLRQESEDRPRAPPPLEGNKLSPVSSHTEEDHCSPRPSIASNELTAQSLGPGAMTLPEALVPQVVPSQPRGVAEAPPRASRSGVDRSVHDHEHHHRGHDSAGTAQMSGRVPSVREEEAHAGQQVALHSQHAGGGREGETDEERRERRAQRQRRREQREQLDREIRHEVKGLARALKTQQETQSLLMMYMAAASPQRERDARMPIADGGVSSSDRSPHRPGSRGMTLTPGSSGPATGTSSFSSPRISPSRGRAAGALPQHVSASLTDRGLGNLL